MGRNFDGVNDNLLSANNAVAGVDVATKSCGVWITLPSAPQDFDSVCSLLIADGAGNTRVALQLFAPIVTGFRFGWAVIGSTNGVWRSPDQTLNARHHLVVTYDRTLTTNDPVLYIDGASVTVTETDTPVGILTGDDTLKVGENAAAGGDVDGTIAHLAIEAG